MKKIITLIGVSFFLLHCEKKGEIDRVEYYCCGNGGENFGGDFVEHKKIHYEKDLSNHKAVKQLMKDDVCKNKLGIIDLNGNVVAELDYCGYEVFYKE